MHVSWIDQLSNDLRFEFMNLDRRNECPVCWRAFSADLPAFAISCGHSLCSDCSAGLARCPLCRAKLSSRLPPVRNYSLQSIIEQIASVAQPEMVDQQVQTDKRQRSQAVALDGSTGKIVSSGTKSKLLVRLKRSPQGDLRSIELLLN